MNLYLRYFDREVFVSNADQAIDFLKSIPEISVDADLEADIREYAASDVCYPKRYKVRPRVYFIVIKTAGWYEGSLDFKRVVLIPATGKFEYRDTHFVANVKAMSGQDCYDRIIEHLRERVDSRSQFPSVKGKNYHFRYLGMWK